MMILGDCLEELKKLAPNSLDSLVTDPPAGISFMGKDWDNDKGGRDAWIIWMTEVMRECLRVLKPGAHGLVWALPRTSHWTATALENAGFEIRDVVTHLFGTGFPKSSTTSLKPASEHWVLIRKPISETSVAKNILKWGTGALNIDASRISCEPRKVKSGASNEDANHTLGTIKPWNGDYHVETKGRFPANLVLDEGAAALLDEQSGLSSARGASRFFYVAKASKSDKGRDNTHPTVKSTALMRYLITLVTPPNGLVLDPFMGSGSTLVAAEILGVKAIGIEKSDEYFSIAQSRLGAATHE